MRKLPISVYLVLITLVFVLTKRVFLKYLTSLNTQIQSEIMPLQIPSRLFLSPGKRDSLLATDSGLTLFSSHVKGLSLFSLLEKSAQSLQMQSLQSVLSFLLSSLQLTARHFISFCQHQHWLKYLQALMAGVSPQTRC